MNGRLLSFVGKPAMAVGESMGSAASTGTTFTTSAPQSASTAPAAGAKAYIDTSMTRTSASRS